MKTRKFPFYVSVAFLALTGVFAFGQEVPPAQAPAQPVQAAEKPAPAAAPAPAPTTEPAQPAEVPEQPAPQAAQPTQAIEQPAPAAEAQPAPTVAPATEPAAPAPAPVQPAAAPVQPAAIPAQPVQPVQASAPSYEAPREAYIQGYGQPPQGFFGYYGYAPCENKECACANGDSANAEPTVKKKKKRAQESEEAEEEPEKEKKSKILHSLHVSIPIESETYDFKKDHFKVDASHFGVGGSWNRIRIGNSTRKTLSAAGT